ncbi:MAG: hypothetical protein U0U46_17635 [Saprospiraceae bacterium]
MKKSLVVALFGLLACAGLPGQNCAVGLVDLLTQADVDNFPINYPGCSVIEGHVRIGYLGSPGSDIVNLNGLSGLTAITGDLEIHVNPQLANLDGLSNITSVGGNLSIIANDALGSLGGLSNLTSVGGDLTLDSQPLIADLSGLQNLVSVRSLYLGNLPQLSDLNALAGLTSLDGLLRLYNLPQLSSLGGLQNIQNIGISLELYYLPLIDDLSGFSSLTTTRGIVVVEMPLLTNLNGLSNVTLVPEGSLSFTNNPLLVSLNGPHYPATAGQIFIQNNDALTDLSALANITAAQNAYVLDNDALSSLNGLNQLGILSDGSGEVSLRISGNPALTSLDALESLLSVSIIEISGNASLSDCSVFAVCDHLLNAPTSISVFGNAPGCNTPAEVAAQCGSTPVLAEVHLDLDGDCQADAAEPRAEGVQVRLNGSAQTILAATDAAGQVRFGYLDNGPFALQLPQFPMGLWAVCQEPLVLNPADFADTVKAALLLTPTQQCPELTVDLGLPSFFRTCLTSSQVEVSTRNTGTVTAQGVQTAVVLPPGLEIVSAEPPVASQNGDTYYFNLGDLPPFAEAPVHLTVKTSCDGVTIGQAFCLEASATLENPCPGTQPASFQIKLTAECLNDQTLRFTLKNVGDAPMTSSHTYKIFRNEAEVQSGPFQLAAQQSLDVDLPADGATYRMEAVKLADGTQTAVSLEGCNGLTPGFVTGYWQDQGPLEYDFGCRETIGSFDPNLKSAVPTGVDWDHRIAADRPLQYTIDFQNTGTDTAFRVLLRDQLPAGLDINSFRPLAYSHPCNWSIRGLNTLEVLFSPIALPDQNTDEPASHGFFSFQIMPKPNLPSGTNLYNTASIIFDFNTPVLTNTVWHRIGQLSVAVDEASPASAGWTLWGNPLRDAAVFHAGQTPMGEQRFELYDANGTPVRRERFRGDQYEFRREGLPAGFYFFRIGDVQGRTVSGKIMIADQ